MKQLSMLKSRILSCTPEHEAQKASYSHTPAHMYTKPTQLPLYIPTTSSRLVDGKACTDSERTGKAGKRFECICTLDEATVYKNNQKNLIKSFRLTMS